MVTILEKSIRAIAHERYRANVYVDGIDNYKAMQLTNALRASGISLRLVQSRRDESEALIRLADMWAGCARSALLKQGDARELLEQAKLQGYLRDLTA